MRTSPSGPSRVTLPDDVPRITSLPSGHTTSIVFDPPSMRVEPSPSSRTFAPRASISGPGPVRTTIDPLRAVIVSRSGAAPPASIGAECTGDLRPSDGDKGHAQPLHRV